MNMKIGWGSPILRIAAAILAVFAFAVRGNAEEGSFLIGVAGSTTTTLDLNEAMKVYFEESVVNSVVTDSELMDIFEQDTNIQEERTGGGRYIETAHMFGYNAGYGARSEDDYIPVPDGPIIKNGRIYLKKAMGSVEMSADVMKKVRQGDEAFITWAEEAMPRLVDRMVNEKDRIVVGFGAGVKARVRDVDSADPDRIRVGLYDAYGVEGYEQGWLAFLEGERVVFGPNINGTSLRTATGGRSARVLDIDDAEDTIIVDHLPDNLDNLEDDSAGDFIFSGDEAGASVMNAGEPREFMGLHGHVDDGGIVATYQNIDRSDFRQWRGLVIDAQSASVPGDGTLSEALLVYADQQVSVRGGGRIDIFVAPVSGAYDYWLGLRNDRVLNDPTSWTGGKGRLTIVLGSRKVEVQSARKLPPQVAFGLMKNTFKRYTLGKFEWDDMTGSLWRQVVDPNGRKDSFWAYGREYEELACRYPRRNVRIENLVPSYGGSSPS